MPATTRTMNATAAMTAKESVAGQSREKRGAFGALVVVGMVRAPFETGRA
jgi:hypothetical protein